MASARGCTRGFVLADAGRICLGDWRFVSAIRGEICGHQPWDSAVEFESGLGIAVGRIRVWRTARTRHLDVRASGRWVAADDAGSGSDDDVVGERRRTGTMEKG